MIMNNWTRVSAVAGKFYPARAEEIERELTLLMKPHEEFSHYAIMVPHAGWIYSGHTAGLAFSQTKVTSTVFIVCPNHTGRGPNISVWSEGEWNTPIGTASVDANLASDFLKHLGDSDRKAHLTEHAIEVQIPFLLRKNPDVKIVPIVLGRLSLEECQRVGEVLASVAAHCLIIASTDMSHFISRIEAQKKDALALTAVENLDPDTLYKTVREEDISMCGFIPTTAVLIAAKINGAQSAKILEYTDSGATTHDLSSVVGYASAVFSRP